MMSFFSGPFLSNPTTTSAAPTTSNGYMIHKKPTPGERVRQEWAAFVQFIEDGPRAEMDRSLLRTFQDLDARWKTTPPRSRPTHSELEQTKETTRRQQHDTLVMASREAWQERLHKAGLRDEDWGDMAHLELLAVERLLGGGLDENGLALVKADDNNAAPEPIALSIMTRSANASSMSSYSMVSPTSLRPEDDPDDDEAYESMFSSELNHSSAPSSDGEAFDPPTHTAWGWTTDSSSTYDVWSAATSQSSRQSSQAGSPERLPKAMPSFAGHSALFSQGDPFSVPQQHHHKPTDRDVPRTRGPRYIGPQIVDSDAETDAFDIVDENAEAEAAFAKFKMDVRARKIREFHSEAAEADIALAMELEELYKDREREMSSGNRGRGTITARSGISRWHEEEAAKIKAHEAHMLSLRHAKESERRELVHAEREKRRSQYMARKAVGTGESLRQRLAQEVESKLKSESRPMPGAFDFSSEPLVPTKRDRRQSQSTISFKHDILDEPMIETDRLGADFLDFLESHSVAESAHSFAGDDLLMDTLEIGSSTAKVQAWLPETGKKAPKKKSPTIDTVLAVKPTSDPLSTPIPSSKKDKGKSIPEPPAKTSTKTSTPVPAAKPKTAKPLTKKQQEAERKAQKAAEDAKKKAELEAEKIKEEQARKEAEEFKRKAAEEARRKASVEEARRKAEEAQRRAIEDAERKAAETKRRAIEEAERRAAEVKRKAIEEQLRREEEEKIRVMHERRLRFEQEEAARQQELARKLKEAKAHEEDVRRRAEEVRRHEEEIKQRQDAERRRRDDIERQQREQEVFRLRELEINKRLAEEKRQVAASKNPSPPTFDPRPTLSSASSSAMSSTSSSTSSLSAFQKKPRPAVELETPGASSSRTTIEKTHRPPIHKSLASDPSMTSSLFSRPPPPVQSQSQVWVSSSAAAAAKKDAAKTASASARVSARPSAEAPPRQRRLSDPVPPAPVNNNKAKAGKKAAGVTIEEVSDEEEMDADAMERLPVDSRYIFEPKPSVPAGSTVFTDIFEFGDGAEPEVPLVGKGKGKARGL